MLTDRSAPVLITGPTGSGKTTILLDLADSGAAARVAVLLSVSERHNDADVLNDELVGAATRAGFSELELILGGQSRPVDGGTFDVVVLLDNIDALVSPGALEVLRAIQRSGIALIATARDPRAQACRQLRLESRATRVDQTALAFTENEVQTLFTLFGVQVEAVLLERIVRRTRGWPAAVITVARHISTAGSSEPDVLESARDEFRDFVTDHVLAQLEEQDLHLLALAAIEDGVVAPIDVTPTGVTDVIARVERLADAGLIVPSTLPLRRRRLHLSVRNAVLWLLRRDVEFGRTIWREVLGQHVRAGRMRDAIRFAMTAGNDDLLREVVEQVWPACFLDDVVVEEALEQLPRDVRHASPSLVVLEGVLALVFYGDVERVEVCARRVTALPQSSDAAVQMLVGYLQLVAAMIEGRFEHGSALTESLLDLLRQRTSSGADFNAGVRSLVHSGLGFFSFCAGSDRVARRHFDAARSAARVAGSPATAAASSAGLALVNAFVGRGAAADRHLADVEAVDRADTRPTHLTTVAVAVTRAYRAILAGDFAAAVDAAESAGDPRGAEMLLPFLAYAQGLAYRFRGDGTLGMSKVETTTELCRELPLGEFQRQTLTAARGVALLGAGRWTEAEQILRSVRTDPHHLLCHPSGVGLACLGRRDLLAALDAVRGCLDLEIHLPHSRIYPLLVAAIAGWRLEEPDAVVHFERAVALAVAGENLAELATIMPRVRAVAELIAAVRQRSGDAELVAACDELERIPISQQAADAAPLLTPREREIALRLGSDLSLSQIADVLFVSINTVKTQLRSVYRKLGVNTREDAVRMLSLNGWEFT